jgi:hypothetical protein
MGEFQLHKEVEGMKYPQEDLNIERHHRAMITYALRKYKSPTEASKHLGVTARTVFRMINRYKIDWKITDINEDKL